MKVRIEGSACIVTREPGDPRFKASEWTVDPESTLLYHIKNILNKQGYDLIKKRMWKDGHMVDDKQQYLRTRKPSGDPQKDIYIWNGSWAIAGAEEDFNERGETTLSVEYDVFKTEKPGMECAKKWSEGRRHGAVGNPAREFEECGCCDQYHPSTFHGDCRDDNNRFNYEEIPPGSIVWEQDERGRWVYCTKEKFEEYVGREVRPNPMKLMTKEIERKARAQYAKGSELEGQMIVAKFFDPQGSWTWYLLNQDPNDPDYLWGIVSGHEVEIGSFSLSELQSVRGRFGLGIERDLYFHPLPAKEAWDRLLAGEHI